MTLSVTQLTQARQAVAQLLEALGLDAYLFEVEPRDGDWEVKVECAVPDGWESVSLTMAAEDLLRAGEDPSARRALLQRCEKTLAACKRRPQQPQGDE